MSTSRIRNTVALATAALCLGTMNTRAASASSSEARHLVAFTFSNGWTLESLSTQAVAWLNQGALTGAGITYLDAYECRPGPRLAEFGERIEFLRQNCRKHIWPVIYTNSMLGFDPQNLCTHSSARSNAARLKKLTAFRGLDYLHPRAAVLRQQIRNRWIEAKPVLLDFSDTGGTAHQDGAPA